MTEQEQKAFDAVHCGYDETTGNCTLNPCCRLDNTDALSLAKILQRPGYGWHSTPEKVAKELLRQNEEIKTLKKALFQMQNAAKSLTAANAVSVEPKVIQVMGLNVILDPTMAPNEMKMTHPVPPSQHQKNDSQT